MKNENNFLLFREEKAEALINKYFNLEGVLEEAERHYEKNLKKHEEQVGKGHHGSFTIVKNMRDVIKTPQLYSLYVKEMRARPNYEKYIVNNECFRGSNQKPSFCKSDYKLTKVVFKFSHHAYRSPDGTLSLEKVFEFKLFPEKIDEKPLFDGQKLLFEDDSLDIADFFDENFTANWGYEKFEGIWGEDVAREIDRHVSKRKKAKKASEEKRKNQETKEAKEKKEKEYKNDYKSVTLKRFYSKELANAYKKEIAKEIPADLSNVGGLGLIVDQHVRDNKGRTAYNVRLVPQSDLGEKKLALFRGLQTEDDQRRKSGRRGAVNKNKKKRTPTKR